MAYKPQSDEEKEILEAYDGVKDAIIQGMMTQVRVYTYMYVCTRVWPCGRQA